MKARSYQTVSAESLAQRIRQDKPDNDDRKNGYALVNVLGREAFEKEHIPGSINIPKGREDEFEKRFSKDKEIIVYCASSDCDASPAVAEKLADMGFTRVRDFDAGMAGWKAVDGPVEGARAA